MCFLRSAAKLHPEIKREVKILEITEDTGA